MIAIFFFSPDSGSFILPPHQMKTFVFLLFAHNGEKEGEEARNWRWKTCVRAKQKNKCVWVAVCRRNENIIERKNVQTRCSFVLTQLNWKMRNAWRKNRRRWGKWSTSNEQWAGIIKFRDSIQSIAQMVRREKKWTTRRPCHGWKGERKIAGSGNGKARGKKRLVEI